MQFPLSDYVDQENIPPPPKKNAFVLSNPFSVDFKRSSNSSKAEGIKTMKPFVSGNLSCTSTLIFFFVSERNNLGLTWLDLCRNNTN